jgi:hypothetical protein
MNKKPELIIDRYGAKYWKLNGLSHREDGPAILGPDGYKEWWLYGKYYFFEDWFQKLTPEQQLNYFWNLDE